ncbi:YkgJ family cysteine cluster protein [Candidatus Thorarchaeota archaeon]|nr:MAG: YkgJ family cysteine cluster protein [Candidatus Thorarchaeota archaeon]
MSDKKKYSFKCLEQKCTTRSCHIRPYVNVTIGDISRWTTQGHLQNILNGVALSLPDNEKDTMRLETRRKPLEKDDQQTACFFYHEDSNGCLIRYSRPISCRTYPLEFNGEKFYVSDKNCPGVGEDEVTKEALREAKELAEQEFEERVETVSALPGLYSIIFGQMLQQSAEAMQNLSEEDRKKLDEIMSKDKQEESDE